MSGLKIVGKIFAVLVSIFYYFALTVLLLLLFSKNLVSGDFYGDILTNIDLSKIKISQAGELFSGEGFDGDMTVEDALVELMTKGDIEEKTARAIITNKEIKKVAGKYIGEYIEYSLGGDKPKIERSDIEIVLNNPDVIEAMGEKPTEEEIDRIYNELVNMVENLDMNGGANSGSFKRNYEDSVNIAR